jgi:glutathione S-transferase
MNLKIYAFPPSPRSFKVLWAANQLGVDYEFKLVDFTKNAQKAPEFVKLNPNGRGPVIDDNGYVVWESNAIVEYLASLKPQSGVVPADTHGAPGGAQVALLGSCALGSGVRGVCVRAGGQTAVRLG